MDGGALHCVEERRWWRLAEGEKVKRLDVIQVKMLSGQSEKLELNKDM